MIQTGRIRSLVPFVVLVSLGMGSGCSRLDLRQTSWWPGGEPKVEIPSRMTCTWSAVAQPMQAEAPTRGFAGRVMFHTRRGKDPVAVDGRFMVLAFDDSEEGQMYAKPVQRFLFPAENLKAHYSQSDLGPSYSFFLPWDKIGGPERRLSLAAIFVPSGGPVILSKPTPHILPGMIQSPPANPLVEKFLERRESWGDVRQTSHEEPVAQPGPSRGLTAATINLTPSFTRQLAPLTGTGDPSSDPRASWPSSSSIGHRLQPYSERGQTPQDSTRPTDATRPFQTLRPPAWNQEVSPQARLSPRRFPVRTATRVRPAFARARTQPRPARSLSYPPSTPRLAQWDESRDSSGVGFSPQDSYPGAFEE